MELAGCPIVSLGRVATRTHTVNGKNIYPIQLDYDSRGNISRKTETVSGFQTTWDFTYDADGQLTGVEKNGADAELYVYDVNGNRTSYEQPGAWRLLADFDSQDRLVRQGGAAYQFNADGQLTQRGSDTFQYSATGELLQATVDGQTITYSYDGMNRRVARTDSTGTTQYLYGDLNNPFQLTALRDPAGVLSYFYYDDGGLLFAFDKGGARYYVATDQVGTPKAVTDAAGTVVKAMEYDSFGGASVYSNPSFEMPVGFAGGLADAKTGLVRFGYRDYEPGTGRWTSKDPIFFKGGLNLFNYVQNNPINHNDPSGLDPTGHDGKINPVTLCHVQPTKRELADLAVMAGLVGITGVFGKDLFWYALMNPQKTLDFVQSAIPSSTPEPNGPGFLGSQFGSKLQYYLENRR